MIQNETEFRELLKIYSSGIEADELSAIGEYTIWYQQIKNKTPKNAMEVFIDCNEEIFHTVHRLLQILITLPVSASSERSFSSVRRLKNIPEKHNY